MRLAVPIGNCNCSALVCLTQPQPSLALVRRLSGTPLARSTILCASFRAPLAITPKTSTPACPAHPAAVDSFDGSGSSVRLKPPRKAGGDAVPGLQARQHRGMERTTVQKGQCFNSGRSEARSDYLVAGRRPSSASSKFGRNPYSMHCSTSGTRLFSPPPRLTPWSRPPPAHQASVSFGTEQSYH
jgi:hypothetical protein